MLLVVILLVSCSQGKQQEEEKEVPLIDLMIGSFDSKKQSEADSTYYHISLHMYPIWKNREGTWLYVEQALASTQDKPYRQRVYQLTALADGTLKSSVFTLKDQDRFIGKWQEPGFFNQFSANSLLEERDGCAVIMKRIDASTFEGATVGKNCISTLSGAAYATSKVTISADRIESWDQGFDSHDEQVWGAEKGGYVFDKLNHRVPVP
ncbi:MAG: chromophore lyase CpcT/CpeT [Roseivirga sp.]